MGMVAGMRLKPRLERREASPAGILVSSVVVRARLRLHAGCDQVLMFMDSWAPNVVRIGRNDA